jgi:hypothetical protein
VNYRGSDKQRGFLIGENMALLKIYTRQENQELLRTEVSTAIKFVAAASLNVPEVPTTPSNVETVFIEGLDLVGIDYVIEVIALERPDQQEIAEAFIDGMNQIYPDKLFSVFFNNISEKGMANTPRVAQVMGQ